MLLELHLSGLGVIEDATLDLSPGLNVLTGETGAGKTMVTTGLALALGRRARSGLVRPGAERASVEARFGVGDHPWASEWAEDGELVLARRISADGRSTARAGGQLAPLSTLAELGVALVEVHGQHETGGLRAPSAQLAFLDRFAGEAHVEALAAYRSAYERLRASQTRLSALEEESREREREKDLLAYQVREIEAAALRIGERAELEAEERRLGSAERILEELARAHSTLAEEGGGADSLGAAFAAVREATAADPGAEPLSRRLESLVAEARDVAEALRSYADAIDPDPERLASIRERIASIKDLERKYGEGENEVLAFRERAGERLRALERVGEEREGLASEAAELERAVAEGAHGISAGRRDAAPRLAEALQAELRELGMADAALEVRLTPVDPLGPDGAEGVEIVFSGGAGQALQPLQSAASGGELSRVMLACRTVLADMDDVPTLVYDEVDAGIGGRAGVAVGRRLAGVASTRQVVVVTHLPQIACFADRHFRVTKDGGSARVVALDEAERVAELSRMLSGMPTEEAATHAEQLLVEASRAKKGESSSVPREG